MNDLNPSLQDCKGAIIELRRGEFSKCGGCGRTKYCSTSCQVTKPSINITYKQLSMRSAPFAGRQRLIDCSTCSYVADKNCV